MLGHFQMSRCRHCRVGAMSKVELAGRPEPGYESMEQFTVNVEHVAEMLRTIDFQPGGGARKGERERGRELPGLSVRTLRVGAGWGMRAKQARTPPHGVFLRPRRFRGGRG